MADAVHAFASSIANLYNDHDAAMARIDARLAELPSEEDRMRFVNMLVREIPSSAYVLRWDVVGKYINSPGLRVPLLGMVLRDSLPDDTDWVIARINESENPELCRRGVDSTVHFIFHSREPAEIPGWLEKSFPDDELFNMGLDCWLSELGSKNEVAKCADIYGQLLKSSRIETKVKSQLADYYMALPSNDTPVDRAAFLLEQGVTDGGWKSLIDAGSRLSGDNLNLFFDSVFQASPYVQGDFVKAYVANHDTADVIADFPSRSEAARRIILIDAADQVFKKELTAQLSEALGKLPLAEANRLADRAVWLAARSNIPLDKITPLMDIGGESSRRMEIYQAPKKWNPQ